MEAMPSVLAHDDPRVLAAVAAPATKMTSAGLPYQVIRSSMHRFGEWMPGLMSQVAAHLFVVPKRHPVPARERAVLADAEQFDLDTRVGRIRAYRWLADILPWGPARPVVMLMHGWEGRATQMGAFVPMLHAAGYDVIALDGPAHGGSDGARADGCLFSMAMRDVADHLAPHGLGGLIAHSLGAGAAMLALADGLRAQRVVLLAPPSSARTITDDYCNVLTLTPSTRKRLWVRLREHFHPYVWDRVEFEARVRDLNALPALVVHDVEDVEVPFARGQAIARAWPGAEFLITAGLGHRRILWHPSVLDAVASFMTHQPPQ
jgi:pimeloyl-ACP methyl ester carboxylesterase